VYQNRFAGSVSTYIPLVQWPIPLTEPFLLQSSINSPHFDNQKRCDREISQGHTVFNFTQSKGRGMPTPFQQFTYLLVIRVAPVGVPALVVQTVEADKSGSDGPFVGLVKHANEAFGFVLATEKF